jgi:carbohydrate kinase (thermoresistant glucokinase family)
MREETAAGRRCIFSCSALKRAYREVLRAGHPGQPPLALVLLQADPTTLAARLAARKGHFMPAALLASQLAALEPQAQGEPAFAAAVRT